MFLSLESRSCVPVNVVRLRWHMEKSQENFGARLETGSIPGRSRHIFPMSSFCHHKGLIHCAKKFVQDAVLRLSLSAGPLWEI